MQDASDDDAVASTSTATTPGEQPPWVTFHILCPALSSGALIGKSGSIIKLLEKETGAKIRIDGSIPGCNERVVRITSAEEPKKKITLHSYHSHDQETEEGEEQVEVSVAQYGLVRVLERILEVGEELAGTFPSPTCLVICRLLADHSQIGHLIGYGGKRLNRIQEQSGTKIKILSDLPACASPNQELVQIIGESMALKKAVLAVSQCLQDYPPTEKAKMNGSKFYRTAPIGSSMDFLPHQSSFPPPRVNSYVDYASPNYSLVEEEVVFRLICPDDVIGGLIGKGGSIVKVLQDQTGASISVAAPVGESNDRVIHVSALEKAESPYSPAQKALMCVFTRSINVGNGKRQESSSPKIVEARIVVSSDQIGCLIGKGGVIISEIRRATRTNMWALPRDQLPSCVTETDAVVRIIGGVENVRKALLIVTDKLREFFFPSKRTRSAGRFADPNFLGSYASAELSHEHGPYSLTKSMQHLGLTNHFDHSPSPMQLQPRLMSGENFGGVMSNGRGTMDQRENIEYGSSSGGTKAAIVKNTTLEILVSVHVLESVRDEKESYLERIRKISGATVTASESIPGASKLTITVSGTPEQTRTAQMVLQAFIQRES